MISEHTFLNGKLINIWLNINYSLADSSILVGLLLGRGKYSRFVKSLILVNSSDFVRSEVCRVKKSEMYDFGNKNVLLFALFVLIFTPTSYCWASMPNLQAIYSYTKMHAC